MSEQQPNVHYVVFHKPGPQWQEGVAFRAQPTISDHIQYYASLLEAGQLAMGGPFLDDSGGMMVATAGVTAAEVETLAAANSPSRTNQLWVAL